ncbi:hypothetical protein BST98_18735 [Photobacterium damselae]|nr:hypothetical protein BST98_18735 [Photobacterium damselae]
MAFHAFLFHTFNLALRNHQMIKKSKSVNIKIIVHADVWMGWELWNVSSWEGAYIVSEVQLTLDQEYINIVILR